MEEDMNKADAQEGSRPPCSNDTKRHKEMENVALQTSLNLGQRKSPEEEQRSSLPNSTQEPEESRHGPNGELELTQTDHLNKRLLTSFLEKINQPNFNFPNLQQLNNQPEDSNKMQEDW
ncbi:hypothetical protein chiPu_0015144 [Chiloscyllium punctatum]|uniref:Uncharacterized protein n=1 Tax=Chiloscyllium punctatum TaxID=137246 RepID=A0A401T1W9_CHIPU|nr:hypothetical protein [Chiloscyllium punctatum]